MSTPYLKFEAVVLISCMILAYNVEGYTQIWKFDTWQTNKIKMATKKFKMAATELKIGQNSHPENQILVGCSSYWLHVFGM